MEYTIGFKIDESSQEFALHTLVLTKDKQIGIIDYAPNRNAEIFKIKLTLDENDGYNSKLYHTYQREDLTIVHPFLTDSDCKEFLIKFPDNYIIFKHKNLRFKKDELNFDGNIVEFIPNKNYSNPTLEQSIVYLEEKYRFSSTGEAYHIMNVLSELKKLKYGIEES